MNIYKKILLISSFALVVPATQVRAMVSLANPTPSISTMQDFIFLLIEIMQLVGIPMLTVAIIYAGFLIVTASGNEEQITKGKQWVMWTLVGATIILGAEVIANFIYGTAALF